MAKSEENKKVMVILLIIFPVDRSVRNSGVLTLRFYCVCVCIYIYIYNRDNLLFVYVSDL